MKISIWTLVFLTACIPITALLGLTFARSKIDTQIILMVPIGAALAGLLAFSAIAVYAWVMFFLGRYEIYF